MKLRSILYRPLALFGFVLTVISGLNACGGGSATGTFTVGGTVSGLGSGKSVVLENNGYDDLTVSSNGSFTFAGTLISGDVYDVKVLTQPTNQVCTVSNGNSTLFGLDVTDVMVNCVTDAHTIGGSVSGLESGKSVVLQNNGGDDLTVSADGAFTFDTALESDTAYTVTVLTPPAGQSCTVNNASGTVSTTDITEVTVNCRAWGAAALIEHDDTADAANPQVAIDAGGNAVAVWQQSDGTRTNIWANRYLAGSGWLTPILIETDDNPATDPRVSVDADGDAVAIWVQSYGTHLNIWANRYIAGSGWGTATILGDGAGDAADPEIATDANGDAVAIWEQSDGIQNNIWANRYTAGWGWGIATTVSNGAADAANPRAAVDANGDAVAVWQQSDGTHVNIWTGRYTVGSGWSGASTIGDGSADAANPWIAMDDGGNAFAVWQQSDGTHINIWTGRYTVGSGWGGASTIGDGSGDAANPRIATDRGGDAFAVWQQSDGTRTNIWANRYTAGGSWGTAALIEHDNAGPAVHPQIGVDDDGNAVAVWQQSDGSRANILSSRYTAGGGWDPAVLIETDNAGDALNPQAAVAGNGNTVAVWEQNDGTRYNIRANVYQ